MSVDPDYANDWISRRSRAGRIIYLNNDVVAYGSRLQPSVARSSTEAEYMAMSMACKELRWTKNILLSIGLRVASPIEVYEDNQPAAELAKHAMSMKRSRHMDIAHHWIRHYVANGTIKIVYQHTSIQRADGMTKALAKGPFEKFAKYVVADTK